MRSIPFWARARPSFIFKELETNKQTIGDLMKKVQFIFKIINVKKGNDDVNRKHQRSWLLQRVLSAVFFFSEFFKVLFSRRCMVAR